MNPTRLSHRYGLLAFALGVGVSVLVTGAPAVYASAGLPPRPGVSNPHNGVGQIQLTVSGSRLELGTVVQWQDGLGGWNNVEGWRGSLDDGQGGQKSWWVTPKNFGQGPFRWVVYDLQTGQVFARSGSFFLPNTFNERVSIRVTFNSGGDISPP